MRVSFKNLTSVAQLNTDALILPFFSDTARRGVAAEADKLNARSIQTAIKRGDFSGKAGEVLVIPCGSAQKTERLVLWGLGDKEKVDELLLAAQCDTLASQLHGMKFSQASIALDLPRVKGLQLEWLCRQLSLSMTRAAYRYNTTKPSQKEASTLKSLSIVGIDADSALRRAVKRGLAMGNGINLARELGNLPGNVCTPRHLASEARKLGRKYDSVNVSVLNEARMEALGMHSLLSVSAGSDEPAQLICIEYKGSKRKQAPEVLVGKGITFDTGGISLKPGAKMDEMKFDMCGAASVIGTMQAVADMQLPINVVGVVAAAENMPSGGATKPGDVVTSMSG
ncbi:leucyl aminopeptidase, partial [bacterium]|nr:leucyl aminopeptidase [bacterium]